ncbi:OmpA family protein [Streptomyces sp. SL13]|uniref:OmpA family protein n=1 Tax=Streptantibioticus silvisoli TaxID=2705255 RepID=A0AA90H0W5_9ACTN|nr:OmpA family protein [Streptantibioticus silvisoli]MDI5963996.1 OmpA family protein [Streptantibioticus silvisoli]MDI5970041.1 OmpA family protein [Streptantibioticus silvisoli]
MTPTARRMARGLAAAGYVVVLTAVGPTAPARAAGAPPPAPPTASAAPVTVDPHADGLRLKPGATLAAPKVLDVVSVVEDSDGDERRSDTTAAVTFDLQAEVLFTKDSAHLSPDASSRIEAIADEIIRQSAKLVRVSGFTDNLGSHAHGVVLSKQRAEAVYSALAKDLPDDGTIQFQVRGYAEDYPIADNSTEAGRRQNRRVEITFAKSDDATDPTDPDADADGTS